MSTRVNPDLKQDLKKFGLAEWNECFHCGNCTATCPMTEEGFSISQERDQGNPNGIKK